MPQITLTRTEMAVFCQLFRTTKTYGWKYPWIGAGKRQIRQQSQEALERLTARNMVVVQSNGKIVVPDEVRDIMRTCCKPGAYLSLHAVASHGGKSTLVCDKNGVCEISERERTVLVAPYIGRKAIRKRMSEYLRPGAALEGEWILHNEALAALGGASGGLNDRVSGMPDALICALRAPEYKIAYIAENYEFSTTEAAVLLKRAEYVFALERYGGGDKTRISALDAERSAKLYASLIDILMMERDE